jgi:hypothetical protein
MAQHKTHWRIDLMLLALFWASCFPNFTGLELHQWLGVAAAGLAAWHMLAHWKWILAVTRRFFSGTAFQARLFYVLDAGVLLGFCMILLTGMMISTWLDLPLYDFAAWTHVHLMVSVFTLLLAAVKLLLHWRWVAASVRQFVFSRASMPIDARDPQRPGYPVGRRDFLKLTGILGAASAVTIHGMIDKSLRASNSSSITDQPGDGNPQPSATAASPLQTSDQNPDPPAPVPAPLEAIPTPDPPAMELTYSCTVRCPNGCVYPGQCRRYTDSNHNGRCDNGECL